MLVYSIYASQGKVATRFWCSGNFNDSFVVNCPQNVSVKDVGNPLRIVKVIDIAC